MIESGREKAKLSVREVCSSMMVERERVVVQVLEVQAAVVVILLQPRCAKESGEPL